MGWGCPFAFVVLFLSVCWASNTCKYWSPFAELVIFFSPAYFFVCKFACLNVIEGCRLYLQSYTRYDVIKENGVHSMSSTMVPFFFSGAHTYFTVEYSILSAVHRNVCSSELEAHLGGLLL